MTHEELKQKLQNIIEKVGATSMKDMGKVMSIATKKLVGIAEGKKINECVKELLG